MNRKKTENYIFESMSAERLPDERVLNKAKSAMSADKTYTPPKIAWKAVLCGAVVIILALAVVLPFVFTGKGIKTNDISYIPMSEISYEQSVYHSSLRDYEGHLLAFENVLFCIDNAGNGEDGEPGSSGGTTIDGDFSETINYSEDYPNGYILAAPYKLESFYVLTHKDSEIAMRETVRYMGIDGDKNDKIEMTLVIAGDHERYEFIVVYENLPGSFSENDVDVSYRFDTKEKTGYATFVVGCYRYYCKIETDDEDTFKMHISNLLLSKYKE